MFIVQIQNDKKSVDMTLMLRIHGTLRHTIAFYSRWHGSIRFPLSKYIFLTGFLSILNVSITTRLNNDQYFSELCTEGGSIRLNLLRQSLSIVGNVFRLCMVVVKLSAFQPIKQ